MLSKLRRKFILLNMCMVTVVLVLLLSFIGAMAHQSSVSAVTDSLAQAIERVERQATAADLGGTALLQAIIEEQGKESSYKAQEQGPSPEIGGTGNRSAIPVAVYAVDGLHNFYTVSQATTASIQEDVLNAALEQTLYATDGAGLLKSEGLYYLKKTTAAGEALVAFADSESASGWKTIVAPLVLAGAGTLVIFLVISLFFSRWALKPVEEAWKKQSQFVADASHELKTPLTVIMANASIAAKDPTATVGSQQKWLDGIQTESKRMQDLINDMLTLAKSDAYAEESLDLKSSRHAPKELPLMDFSTVVEAQALQFESVAFEQGIGINESICSGIQVHANKVKIERLVTILLDNACKYAAPGSSVDLSLAKEGKLAKLSVRNFGNVIAAEDLPHVFDRFYRADKARTRSEAGKSSHGLGLAIAAGIAKEHDGSIAVTSCEEEGTVFTVTLPLAD